MDTELIITFSQLNTYWLGLTATQWISIVAALITFGIMVAALIQWAFSRKAHKQSHTPFLKSDLNKPEPRKVGYVTLTNSGLGPALLQEINILRDGEVVKGNLRQSFNTIFSAIGEKAGISIIITRYFSYQKGYPVGRDESIRLVEFDFNKEGGSNAIEDEMKNQAIQLQVVYLDMFGDRHTILDPKPEQAL